MVNMNDFKFGDKLKLSNGEMGIYAGWYYPYVSLNNEESPKYIPSKDKLHNIIVKHETYFGIVQVYDYGHLHGDIHVIGKWEDTQPTTGKAVSDGGF